MKKILIIHHGTGLGGGLIALLGIIDELKEKFEVEVFAVFDSVAVDYLKDKGIKVIVSKSKFYKKHYSLFVHSDASYFNVIEGLLNLKSLITFLLSKYYFSVKELRLFSKNKDLIYLNSTFLSDWAYAAKKLNIKTLIHVREPLSYGKTKIRYNIIRNTIKKNCDQIVAITKDNANRVNLFYKTEIIYDPVVLNRRDEKLDILIDNNTKYFIYLGGEYRIKGFEQLVNSLPFIDENIKIFFLGGKVIYSSNFIKQLLRRIFDPYFNRIKDLKIKLNASDKIIDIGMTDNVFYFYKKSIALICPFSKPHAALPILEAFSLKVPVIASDVVGMAEFVNENNGLTFLNGNSQSLAYQINQMAKMPRELYDNLVFGSYETYSVLRKKQRSITFIINELLHEFY
ncbi:glycosyltransferase family 4 protein [Flavobacterium sp. NRK1]|uniref:glycosyltransferase family 4 protein n=1 Tax=Flavobacterium sp. NRK1 TaxID=2954929 RepID=UPI0020936144|nr:glycosyltransferase family 4 protein [Flavobacterium sp. NRK1]MCO6146891.1 glycosyltransferase family 4 protein [Flavobacterium sp. NRK1]